MGYRETTRNGIEPRAGEGVRDRIFLPPADLPEGVRGRGCEAGRAMWK